MIMLQRSESDQLYRSAKANLYQPRITTASSSRTTTTSLAAIKTSTFSASTQGESVESKSSPRTHKGLQYLAVSFSSPPARFVSCRKSSRSSCRSCCSSFANLQCFLRLFGQICALLTMARLLALVQGGTFAANYVAGWNTKRRSYGPYGVQKYNDEYPRQVQIQLDGINSVDSNPASPPDVEPEPADAADHSPGGGLAQIWDNEELDTYVDRLDTSSSLDVLNGEGNFGYFMQRVKWMLETCTDENPMLIFLGRPWMLPKTSRLRVLWEGRQGTRRGFRTLLEQQGRLLLESERGIAHRRLLEDGKRSRSDQKLRSMEAEEAFLKDLVQAMVEEQFGSSGRSAKTIGKTATSAPTSKSHAQHHLEKSLRKFARNLDETAAVLQESYKFLRLTSHTHIVLGKRLLGLLGHYVEKCVNYGCPDDREEIAMRVDSLAQNYLQDATLLLRGDFSSSDPRFWRGLDETEKSLSINSTDPFFERKKYPNVHEQDEESSSASGAPGGTSSGENADSSTTTAASAPSGGEKIVTGAQEDDEDDFLAAEDAQLPSNQMVRKRGPRTNLNKVQRAARGSHDLADDSSDEQEFLALVGSGGKGKGEPDYNSKGGTNKGPRKGTTSKGGASTKGFGKGQKCKQSPDSKATDSKDSARDGAMCRNLEDDAIRTADVIRADTRDREYYLNLNNRHGQVGPLAAVYRAFEPKMTKEMLFSHYLGVVLEFLDALTAFIQKEPNFPGTMLQLVQKISDAHCGLQYRLNAHASMFLTTHAMQPPTLHLPWSYDRRFVFEDRACCRRYHVLGRLMDDLRDKFGHNRQLVGVEVGVNNAITSQYLLKNIPDLRLTGLDPFINVTESIQQMSYDVFGNYPDRAELIKIGSEDFVDSVPDESLDFVFIDGDHSFSAVVRDLEQWVPKVRKGGLVSGHDLFNPAFEGVFEALTLLAEDYPRIHYGFDFLFYWWKPGGEGGEG
ncbi:unnamed protein product [Amoebophrya sp. A120]|nr:unnamed protein product [Amoebophrya sp. A120]|eukprot:GSA120T00005103001.1